MDKDKLILRDGAAIELEAGASLGAIQVSASDRSAMLQIWEKLTEGNLAEVNIQNGSGLTVGIYKNLVLVSETSIVKKDGTVITTYCLREKTDMEKRLDNVEAGQAIQDGAIADLGEVSSLLAEQICGYKNTPQESRGLEK